MDNDALIGIGRKIDKLFTDCVISAIKEAMTASYGDAAFAEFVRIDDENTKAQNKEKQKNGKKQISPITLSKSGFSGFDVQACAKTLLHLTAVRDMVFSFFGIDNANETVVKALDQPLKTVIKLRNQKTAHVEGAIHEKVLKECANAEILIVETLFPERADPSNKLYLQQMEQALADFLAEKGSQRYAVEDHVNPKEYDLNSFFEVCAKLKLKSEMKGGIRFFYSADLDRDLDLLKNNLPRRTASFFEPDNSQPEILGSVQPRRQKTAAELTTKQEGRNKRGGIIVAALAGVALALTMVLVFLLVNAQKTDDTQGSSNGAVLPAQTSEHKPESFPQTDPISEEVTSASAAGRPRETETTTSAPTTTEGSETIHRSESPDLPAHPDLEKDLLPLAVQAYRQWLDKSEEEQNAFTSSAKAGKVQNAIDTRGRSYTRYEIFDNNLVQSIADSGLYTTGYVDGTTYILAMKQDGQAELWRIIVEAP